MVPLQKLLFAGQIKCGIKFRCSVNHGSVDNPLNQHNNSQGQLQYFPDPNQITVLWARNHRNDQHCNSCFLVFGVDGDLRHIENTDRGSLTLPCM